MTKEGNLHNDEERAGIYVGSFDFIWGLRIWLQIVKLISIILTSDNSFVRKYIS